MSKQTMRGYVMNCVGDASVQDRTIPPPGPNCAIVRTTLALVCTSDRHTIHGGLGEIVDRYLGHRARIGITLVIAKTGAAPALNIAAAPRGLLPFLTSPTGLLNLPLASCRP